MFKKLHYYIINLIVFICLAYTPTVFGQGIFVAAITPFAYADTLHQHAIAAFSANNYIFAKQILMLAELPLRHSLHQQNKISDCFYTLSFCYSAEKNDCATLDALHKAIAWDATNWDAYNSIAATLYTQGEYKTAAITLQTMLRKAQNTIDSTAIATACIDLSNVYPKLNQLDTAIICTKIGLQYANSTVLKFNLHLNAGNAYLLQQNYLAALREYQNAQLIGNKIADLKPSMALVNLNIGILEKRNGHYSPALTLMQSVLPVFEAAKDTRHIAIAYNNMADVFVAQKDYLKAIFYYDKAAVLSVQSKGNLPDRFIFLGDKANCLRAQENTQAALAAFQATDAVVDTILQNDFTTSSKLDWREKVHYIYSNAIAVCDAQNDKSAAWQFVEKSRAMLLLEQVAKQKTMPAKLHILTPKEVQTQLLADGKTAYIAYFSTTENYYAFTLTRNTYTFQKLPLDANLRAAIAQYKTLLAQNNSNVATTDSLGFLLYNKLLQPLPIKACSRLIISTDGALNGIPFDALRDKQGFLVQKYAISTAYSASLLYHTSRTIMATNKSIIGFAPIEYRRFNLATLNSTREGLERISTLYKTTAFYGNEATKENFTVAAADYQILQLFTHAQAQPSREPTVYFADDTLTLAQLEALHLHADLAVLTACETGTGSIAEGEGVMSLSRGFAYAGVPATVSTLWSVPEKASVAITAYFYAALDAGKTKDAALREAKQQYIADENGRGNHTQPYYWAAPVLYGNTDAISLPHKPSYLLWCAIGLFLSGLGYFIYKKIVLV